MDSYISSNKEDTHTLTSSGTENDLFLPSSVFTVMSNMVYHTFISHPTYDTMQKSTIIIMLILI